MTNILSRKEAASIFVPIRFLKSLLDAAPLAHYLIENSQLLWMDWAEENSATTPDHAAADFYMLLPEM